MRPLIPSTSKSSLHPFDEETTFKLSDRGDDCEDSLTEWGAGVDLLTDRYELDVEMSEQFKGINQVAYRSTEAIEGCYHNDIDSPFPDDRHQFVEGRASIRRTRDTLIDELGDLIPSTGTAVLA
jgi:hypothetical protein